MKRATGDDWLVRVAELARATSAERDATLQILWGGYGEIVRVKLEGGAHESVVVKHVRPPRAGDFAHRRKLRSYEVETAFYRSFASRCDDACRVARSFGSFEQSGERLLVLEDLDAAGFGGRTHRPRAAELDACLGWLAHFHARFLGEPPAGLWKTGTYWHLATRPDELEIAARKDPSVRDRAKDLDRRLAAARFRTLVHGDAKPANFCFGKERVAAVDFQYVGGGAGIVDVAYLLHGERDAARSLDAYFSHLRSALAGTVDASALESEWRALHPIAVADFERFLAGWR